MTKTIKSRGEGWLSGSIGETHQEARHGNEGGKWQAAMNTKLGEENIRRRAAYCDGDGPGTPNGRHLEGLKEKHPQMITK